MKPDAVWARGNTLPAFSQTLRDANGVVSLTDATVKFRMWHGTTPDCLDYELPSPSLKIDAAATIVAPATAGNVSYTPTATDTDTPGYWLARWKVTFASGGILEFPNDRPLSILITDSP
jgi:hypothetical protein